MDYKATAKSEPVTALNEDWHDGYKRQMEIYQWLLRHNGLDVSDTGYFVYCTGRPDGKHLMGKWSLTCTSFRIRGVTRGLKERLRTLKQCLDSNTIPRATSDCDYCTYRAALKSEES